MEWSRKMKIEADKESRFLGSSTPSQFYSYNNTTSCGRARKYSHTSLLNV